MFRATFIGIAAIGVCALLALTACVNHDRYEEGFLPHETWKDRSEYCYFVEVDPRGMDNTTYFWADEIEEGYGPDGLSNIRGRDVRVSDGRDDEGPSGAHKDSYQQGIIRIIEDGSIEIDVRCWN